MGGQVVVLGLFVTAALQLVVVLLSHSVAPLADTIHNFGDAATGIPLGVAFLSPGGHPTRVFTMGYGRGKTSPDWPSLLDSSYSARGSRDTRLWSVCSTPGLSPTWAPSPSRPSSASSGNEVVAVFRIRVGKEIGSAALIADGISRPDRRMDQPRQVLLARWASTGLPEGRSDYRPPSSPWLSWHRLAVGPHGAGPHAGRVEPEVLDEVRHAAEHVPGVLGTSDVRARWVGHRLRVEANVAVRARLTVVEGHRSRRRSSRSPRSSEVRVGCHCARRSCRGIG